MSYYDDEPRPRRSHRKSRPVYEEEIIERRTTKPTRESGQMDLVRRRDSDESIEEVRRDFPPGDGAYVQRRTTTRDRYAPRRRSADYYDDNDSYYDSRRRDPPRRSSRRDKRYEADSESDSPSPPRRRKSISEQALAALGLGGAAAAASGRKDKDRRRDRDRDSDYDDRRDRTRNRGRGRFDDDDNYSSHTRSKSVDDKFDQKQKIIQAAKAAVTAGAIEAWRSRKEPGGFAGQGKRVLTAAIGAAGIDGVLDRGEEHKTRHTIEAALGGLAGNRLINGARSQSRSRKDGKEGADVGGIASAAGLAALAGKAFNDYRSRSRGRGEDRDGDGSPDGRRSRSRSVSEYISRGVDGAMAKLGLSQPKNEPRGRDRGGRYDDDDSEGDYRARPRGGGAEEKESGSHSSGSSSSSSDTDSYDSEKEVKKQRRLKRKSLLTAGLASVATIHAVAGVHGSMEKAKERHKKVLSGKMSEAEAKKKKSKALLQDAAAVGIAAIGIKSAFSELKEVKENREKYHKACHRFEEKREHRRQKMLQEGSQDYGGEDKPSRYSDDEQRRHSDHGPYYYDDNPYGARDYPLPPQSSRLYRDDDDRRYH